MRLPARKMILKSLDPFRYTCLAGIDFLAATYKAYDRAPIGVTIHHSDEKTPARTC